jgi:hypothetical protein
MDKTIVIDDLIVLGRAVPEPIKDGRTTVCLGGYSHELGFVRVYPTRTDMKWHRWDVVRVEVEKDVRDTRAESWKILGSRTEWDNLSSKIQVIGSIEDQTAQRNLAANLADDCVNDINDARRSLGVVKPSKIEPYFAHNPHYGQLFQMVLPGLGESTKVKRDFQKEPRVKYQCADCKTHKGHDQQILEWGFYEWFRKNPDNIDQIWENAQFNSPDHDIYFFVGNQFRHRTSYMVISVLRIKKGPVTPPLFPLKKG